MRNNTVLGILGKQFLAQQKPQVVLNKIYQKIVSV